MSLPGIAGGFLLVFSIAISAYATPAILGGPATQVAATAIYNFIIQLLDWSLGAALAVILIVSSLLLLYAASRVGRQAGRGMKARRAFARWRANAAPWALLRAFVDLRLRLFARADPDHRGGLVQCDQPLVLPAARLLAALVGARVGARVDRPVAGSA